MSADPRTGLTTPRLVGSGSSAGLPPAEVPPAQVPAGDVLDAERRTAEPDDDGSGPGVVGIVGAGLIGTSIGLALARAGVRTVVYDADGRRAAAAAALGAGTEAVHVDGLAACDHVVVAVPPPYVTMVVSELARLDANFTISDTTSTKANVVREVETILGSGGQRFCGAHPIAGRERGGPGAALPTLFENAAWVVTPTSRTGERARGAAVAVAALCGARVVEMDPAEHDDVLAAVSHTPQLVASTLAATLTATGPRGPELAGSGFRDTTRLADSDPDLWTAIAMDNGAALVPALRRVAVALTELTAAVEAGDQDAVRRAIQDGNAARALLPGKPASAPRSWHRVGVVVPDRPGELARLLSAAGAAAINVEDLTIEHAPDHPAGYVHLDVRPDQAAALARVLTEAGWAAHEE